MEIIYRKVKDLIPYERNPRKNDESVGYVAESIKQFGFKVPIVIDKNGTIVTGHTRLKAAKKLKLKEVPCIVADDLTEDQIKAFRLADNKVSEFSDWDYDMLELEIEDIDLDLEQFGFEFDFMEEEEPHSKGGLERLRTDEAYNLEFNDPKLTAGWFEMPTLQPEKFIPEDLIGFNYVLNTENRDAGVHFFLDDYQFERIWNDPEFYIEKLKSFQCMLTPNFSLYMDMPIATKIWNTYRSRLIGQIAQREGLKVIPTICWAEKKTYDFCFDGIEKGSVLAVSSIGVKNSKEAVEVWKDGCSEMLSRLDPAAVILYGGEVKGFDWGGVKVVEFGNHVTENMKR